MAALMPNGKQQYFDNNGDPLSGGKLYTYFAGTSTPQATYTTAAGNIANTNPVILDSRGEASVFWGASRYKAVLKSASDVEIWTQDNIQSPGSSMPSILDFGAAGDGSADDTTALNLAAAYVGNVFFPPGIYTTTTGVALVRGCRWFGAGNWSGVASTDSSTGNSVIKYTGAGGSNSCVVRIAAEVVGTEPTNPSTRDMQNIAFSRFTIDGNQLAEFGLYTVRAWSNNVLDFVTVTGTTKHAFYAALCWNGSPRNWHAFKNIGCGITLGRNIFSWSNATVDQSTCISFFGYYSGVNSSTVYQNDFNDSTDTEKEYGIGVYGCRAVVFINAQGQECGGAGVFIKTTLSPVRFVGGYFENNGRSSGSTKEWAIWIEGASTADSWYIDFDGTHLGNGPAIKLTGTEPSRLEAGVTFRKMPFLGEIHADWDGYRLIDCDRNVSLASCVTAVAVTAGGSSYTDGGTVTITPTNGTGATGTVTVVSGAVTAVAITAGGSGYTNGAVAAIYASDGSGWGAYGTLTVAAGAVTAIAVVAGGSNYTNTEACTIGASVGTGASGTITAPAGAITAVTIPSSNSGGVDYLPGEAVTLTGAGGSGATGTVTVLSGSRPTSFRQRLNSSMNSSVSGICVFDATAGNISILNKEGIIQDVRYVSTGTYAVVFREGFSSSRATYQVTGGDNRIIGTGSPTANGFTIFNRTTAGTLVDSNTSRVCVTVWGFYQ